MYQGSKTKWQKYKHKPGKNIWKGILEPFCSFCGKSMLEVKEMIPGKKAFICDKCVQEFAKEILTDT